MKVTIKLTGKTYENREFLRNEGLRWETASRSWQGKFDADWWRANKDRFLLKGLAVEVLDLAQETDDLNGTEASDLGWRPGEWPEQFTHEGKQYLRREPFFQYEGTPDQDLAGFWYESDGRQVKIFND